MNPAENKFHAGNRGDGKHYWLTPPSLMQSLQTEFAFDFDPCPFPKPENFDGLTADWGTSNYVNPPFGSIMHQGKKKGPTAWVRKAIEEHAKGKRVVLVFPVDKWILMLVKAGAEIRNLGDGYNDGCDQTLLPASAFAGVRRLTPTECERLQGFLDGWTAGFADSVRYRMLGNAVCVNVAEWIGKRLVNQGRGEA